MPSGILAFGAFFNALGGASMRTNLVSSNPCSSPETPATSASSPYSARTSAACAPPPFSTPTSDPYRTSHSPFASPTPTTRVSMIPLSLNFFPVSATSPAFTTTTTSPLDPSREYVGLSFPCSARARRDANRPTISPRASTRRTREPSRFGTFLASARAASLTARARGDMTTRASFPSMSSSSSSSSTVTETETRAREARCGDSVVDPI